MTFLTHGICSSSQMKFYPHLFWRVSPLCTASDADEGLCWHTTVSQTYVISALNVLLDIHPSTESLSIFGHIVHRGGPFWRIDLPWESWSVTFFEKKHFAQKKSSCSPLHGNNLKARNVGEAHVDFSGAGGSPHTSVCLTNSWMSPCDYLQEQGVGFLMTLSWAILCYKGHRMGEDHMRKKITMWYVIEKKGRVKNYLIVDS